MSSSPIPIGRLAKERLSSFLPAITEELRKESILQDDGRTKRGTIEYGYSFFALESCDRSFRSIPSFFQDLGEIVCKELGHFAPQFTNVILSVYNEGFHLEPHEDVNDQMEEKRCYYFGNQVYGIVIEADSIGHLYFVKDEVNRIPPLDLPKIFEVKEEDGTVYCLTGDYRKFPYFHGVSKVGNKRISVTFRTVEFVDGTL